ncbi:MAG: hypothetical protein KAS66_02860 [Candidatus Omnitrophica bacterium]|nr:hypothetical protein [Candidatus Omnitrophota bacterium]
MIDYTCLGQNKAMRERRYKVLKEFVKGKTPKETAEILDLPMKQVENDRLFITNGGLKNTPAEVVRELNNSYYEIKHAELETEAKRYIDDDDRRSYIAIQKVIGDNKAASLKLMGFMNEKVEHSGTIVTIVDNIPHNKDVVHAKKSGETD